MELVKDYYTFIQENIWTGAAMFGLMIVSLVFLSFDRNRSVRRLVCYSVLLLACVLYNFPFFYGVIQRFYPNSERGAHIELRLFWMVPFFLLMALFLGKVMIASRRKGWLVSCIVAACSVVFIIWAGKPFHPDVVVKRSNWYKVSQEGIDSAELILKDMKEHPEHLMARPTGFEVSSTDVMDDISQGNSYHFGIRQYTSDFTLTPVWITPEAYEAEGFDIANYYNMPAQYMILEEQMEAAGNTAQRYGYHEFARNGSHILFRYAREAAVYLVIRGQTLGDTSGELRGTSGNASLTTAGWWSILKAGRELADVKFDYVYASDAGQSKATAGIILRENQNRDNIPAVTPVISLNDMTWGAYEGYKKADVVASFGAVALDNGGVTDASYASPIGAESRYTAANRFKAGMGDIVKRLEEDGKTILVVANPSISWWLKVVTGDMEMEDLKPGDWVKLEFLDGGWRIA